MSDYTNTYTEGDGDTIDAADFSTEFAAIETAIATKADTDGDTLTNLTIGSGFSGGALVQETTVATTSGTTVDFTGIPSWAKKISVLFDSVSSSTTSSVFYVRIGDSGGFETTGYSNTRIELEDAGDVITSGALTIYFGVTGTSLGASSELNGIVTLMNITGNRWVCSGSVSAGGLSYITNGAKTLTGALDRVQIGTTGASMDNGQVNIIYEG